MANYTLQISQMTVSEFKAFKKALALLKKSGMNQEDAIELLVPLVFTSRQERQQERMKDSFARFNRESGYQHG